jgi:hypothetical protein
MITCPECHGAGTVQVHPSRYKDPETSKINGERNRLSPNFSTRSQLARLLWLIAQQPMTAQEAAITLLGQKATVSQIESARRRVSDLRKLGLVMETEDYGSNEGGGEALIWEITGAGLHTIELLQTTGWSQ